MPRKAAPKPAPVTPAEPPVDAPDTPVEALQSFTVTNDVKGRTLHLGDGRRLAFGESAQVSAEIAALMGRTK